MATVKILCSAFAVISHWTLALCEMLFEVICQRGEDAKIWGCM